MIAGPGVVGAAQAHAILGLGPDWLDIFGGDKKSDMHHPRPGSEVSADASPTTARVASAEAPTARASAIEAPTAKGGSLPENVSVPTGLAQSGGGGGGGLPRTNIAVRSGNLPRVSSAPVTRSVVIRGAPRSANPAETIPAFVSPTVPQAPAVVALAAPPPVAPEPAGRPAPAAPPAPSPSVPQAKDPLAPSDSGAARIPDSYRVGYSEHLKSATTGDLFMAALPGVAGIAGFTLVGAYAGYRQAKALQRALLAPVPTRIVL
jgi:hypothetical protein